MKSKGLRLLALCMLAGSAAANTVSVSVVDRDGNAVPDAVVVVTPAMPPVPVRRQLPAQAQITQQGMRFVPAVSVVAVGARLTFTNNDPWEHHVRGSAAGAAQFSAPGPDGGFELRLDGKTDNQAPKAAEVTVGKPGAVLLGCHLHASMRGHVYVSESPWSAKTGTDGSVTFDDLPPGPAQVRVWQADQLVDLPARAIVVSAQPARVQMQLQVVPRRRRL